jgi:hypothetical protein
LLLRVLQFPSSLLTILELRTRTKGKASGSTITNASGDASRGERAMRFTTSNPFAVLDTVLETRSDGSGSSASVSLSDGSTPQNSYGYGSGGAALTTPARGSVLGDLPSGRQHLVSKRSFCVSSYMVY